jgi:hypothetical protein
MLAATGLKTIAEDPAEQARFARIWVIGGGLS